MLFLPFSQLKEGKGQLLRFKTLLSEAQESNNCYDQQVKMKSLNIYYKVGLTLVDFFSSPLYSGENTREADDGPSK